MSAACSRPVMIRRINREKKRLMAMLDGVDQNKMDFVAEQVQRLAWFNVSIAALQARIDATGTQVEYDNGGGQKGTRQNPDIKTLIEYQKQANAITKILLQLVPSKGKSNFASALSGMLSTLQND